MELRLKEDKGTWPIPWDATLDPLATITNWGIFGEEINENAKLLGEMWWEAPVSSIHKPWP